MNIVEIPIASSAAHFVQENDIFGRAYHLEFEWIENEGFWMFHVVDGNEKPLVLGIKLQPDWPLVTIFEAYKPFSIMLLSRSSGQALERRNLNRQFSLVAYEAF